MQTTDTRNPFYSEILSAMQACEEIGGPNGIEYVRLMIYLAMEATLRAQTYLAETGEKLDGLRIAQNSLRETLENFGEEI